jgi:hypothetical protein
MKMGEPIDWKAEHAKLAAELAAAHIQCAHNQLTINALGDELARCRAANVYDGEAHRKVSALEAENAKLRIEIAYYEDKGSEPETKGEQG